MDLLPLVCWRLTSTATTPRALPGVFEVRGTRRARARAWAGRSSRAHGAGRVPAARLRGVQHGCHAHAHACACPLRVC